CWPPLLAGWGQPGRSCTQALLASLGTLLVLVNLPCLRPWRGPIRRSFLFADALHLWEVSPDEVSIIGLAFLSGASGSHRFADGYRESALVLTFCDHSRSVVVHNQAGAELLLTFLQALIALRGSDGLSQTSELPPGQLGALAHHLAVHGSSRPWQ